MPNDENCQYDYKNSIGNKHFLNATQIFRGLIFYLFVFLKLCFALNPTTIFLIITGSFSELLKHFFSTSSRLRARPKWDRFLAFLKKKRSHLGRARESIKIVGQSQTREKCQLCQWMKTMSDFCSEYE